MQKRLSCISVQNAVSYGRDAFGSIQTVYRVGSGNVGVHNTRKGSLILVCAIGKTECGWRENCVAGGRCAGVWHCRVFMQAGVPAGGIHEMFLPVGHGSLR